MLNGKDKETGAKMSDESIGYNVRFVLLSVMDLVSCDENTAAHFPDCWQVLYTSLL